MQDENMQPPRAQKPAKGWKREALEWALTLIIGVGLALIIRTFVFSPFTVDGHSMAETLANGELMFTTKYDYWLGGPSRFDVVICRYPGRSENFVKRVVGIPGDTVAVRGGTLYVNGERVPEDYIVHHPDYEMREYALEPGEYFVLGDNRSNSNDSHIIGPLARDQIIAHVRAVVFPFTRIRGIR